MHRRRPRLNMRDCHTTEDLAFSNPIAPIVRPAPSVGNGNDVDRGGRFREKRSRTETCEVPSAAFRTRMQETARDARRPVRSPVLARSETVRRLGDCAPHTSPSQPPLPPVPQGGVGRFCASPLQSSPETALRVVPGNQRYGSTIHLSQTPVYFLPPSGFRVIVDLDVQTF